MAQIVSDLADHIGGEARQAYERMVSREGNLYYINRKSFADLDRAIQRELVRLVIGQAAGRLKDIEMVHIEAVRRLFDGRTGSRTDLPYGLAAVREYESVKIGPLPKKEGQGQSLEISLSREETGRRKMVAFEGKKLTFCLEEADGAAGGNLSHFPQKMYTKWFDYDKIKCTLCLRRRMGGDYMMISGGKKKLLRRILIDDRIPADRRDSLLVLADGQHVMWLFDNGRISEYYKVTEGTRNILKVEVSEMD